MPLRLLAGRASISGTALALIVLLSLLTGPPAAAAGGTLSGTLTGPGGDRFEYFQVEVFRANGPGRWTPAIPPRVVTSWDSGLPVGDFAISLPTGTYRACFRALAYESSETVGQSCWQGAFEVFDATDVVVTEGATTTITPRLPRESRLRGRITGPGGVGVSAYVAPYRRGPDGTWVSTGGGQQSSADGAFVVPDVDPGRYRVCVHDAPRPVVAECWENAATLDEADDLTVPAGADVPLRFRLAPRASIAGTVTRPPSSTDYLYVTPYGWNGERWLPVAVGAAVADDGRYRIAGLDAGTYRVCVSGYDVVGTCWQHGSGPEDATDVVLATGQARGRIDLAPGPAGFVTGMMPEVYLGAQGYPTVAAWRRVDGGWRFESSADAVPTGVGSEWTYAVGSLPSGTYVVCASHTDPEFVPAFATTCRGGSPSPAGGLPLEVVAGQTTPAIDIATSRRGAIRGRVAGTTEPVRVDLVTAAGRLAVSRTTSADGSYRFDQLPAGTFFVGFNRDTSSSPLAAEWWRNTADGPALAVATPITLDGDLVAGVSATLDPGGVITGRLVDPAGDGVAGCQVRARAADGSLAARVARTDATGAFGIGGLSSASYLVVVPASCSGTPTAMSYDADSPTRTSARAVDADPVAVTRGRTTALPADLVTGRPAVAVTDPPTVTGTPAVGRTLTARPGSWLPTTGLTFAYRWYADGREVTGATRSRLVLTPDLAGADIVVRVIAQANGWLSGTARSAPVGPVTGSARGATSAGAAQAARR